MIQTVVYILIFIITSQLNNCDQLSAFICTACLCVWYNCLDACTSLWMRAENKKNHFIISKLIWLLPHIFRTNLLGVKWKAISSSTHHSFNITQEQKTKTTPQKPKTPVLTELLIISSYFVHGENVWYISCT